MSKVSFRARQIDFNKPLPIIRSDAEILSEINENSLVNRGVPVLPSGMEKEEENEHHLVEVLHAIQSKKTSGVVIPVPEIEEDTLAYFKLYEKGFSPPNHFIHIRTIVLAEEEPIEYDMDSDDEAWLTKNEELNITPDQFESMIYTLERGCGQKVINLDEAKFLLQNYATSLVIAIYDYWLTKRVQCRQPLILTVRQEKKTNDQANDPYIAFRRRTERMQTRKNRKNDEYSYEKMLILREQMESLGDIIEKLVKRECIKKDLVDTEKKIFSCRYQSKDFDSYLINEITSQCYRMPKEKSNDYSTSPSHNSDLFRSSSGLPNSKGYQQCSPKRNRLNMKSSLNKKKRSSQKKMHFGSNKLQTGSIGEYSDEENLTSEGESQSLTSSGTPTSFSSFTRIQGCKYLRPTTNLEPMLKERRSQLLHPYLSYSLATVPSIHSKFSNYTGYLRRRIGRGGRLIIDRVPCDMSDSIDQTSYNVNQVLAKNDLNRMNDRLDLLSSQLLTVSQQAETSKYSTDGSLFDSISNRLRWSKEFKNWRLSTDYPNYPQGLKEQISNFSPQHLRKLRLLASFDDRPSEKIKMTPDQGPGKDRKHLIKPPLDSMHQNDAKLLNGSCNDNVPSPGSKGNRQSRTILTSNESSSPVKAGLTRNWLGLANSSSNPLTTGASTILTSSSPSPSANNNSKRCRISLTSQIPGSSPLEIDKANSNLAKTNGSSNYCFFVPTPNNNSQTASNV